MKKITEEDKRVMWFIIGAGGTMGLGLAIGKELTEWWIYLFFYLMAQIAIFGVGKKVKKK